MYSNAAVHTAGVRELEFSSIPFVCCEQAFESINKVIRRGKNATSTSLNYRDRTESGTKKS